MTALSFFIGGIIAYGVLSLYWKERSVRYKLISGGIFCLLIFISAFVACREYFYFTIFRISLIKMRDTPINV